MESTPPTAGDPKVKTRLMITKMVLENFKSYAGAQEIGPFHKRFSSVVGPNGSGKSNVIDALLFVFGKRAKQLRLNKVSELIHKSSGFPSLEYAKVEVHFQLIIDDEESADDFEVVPGSEFVVTRTADMKNQSKYTVDGKGSTYTEVGLLLRKHGIDLDNNRFLILQGEVEQIAMMKPKAQSEHEDGLLEYLEDIIGSNQFAQRIGEIGVKLEGLNEQRVDKVNRLKKAEKDRDELSSSKEGAEAYMAREQNIRKRQNALYQVHESTALDNVKQFATRRDEAKAQLEHERLKMKDGEKELTALESAYTSKKKEYDAVSVERNSVEANFAAYERKDLELQENIKHSKAQVDKYRAAVSRDTKKEEESLRVAAEALASVTLAKGKISDAEASKETGEARLEEIHEGLREATQDLRDSLEGTQSQLADAERATASIQTDKEGAETSLQLLQSRSNAAVQAVSTTESKIAALGGEAEKAGQKKISLEEERRELDGRVKALEAQVLSSSREETALQAGLRAALTSLEEARATLLSQQESGPKGRSKELEALMAAAKKGGPLQHAGLRGRLGDLGTIDPEFDVAISTCCSWLDYIVVDTSEGGQACINFLREKNIGRANFVVIEQSGQHRAGMERSQALKLPAGSRRVLDLVTPSDPALLTVFYMALRDTLVAKDLDSAVAMAYQGGRPVWRVVTTDGNLIDISGTMSGGGKQARSGGMRLSGTAAPRAVSAEAEESISPQQIAALEGEVSQCEAQLSQCRAARNNAQVSVKDSNKRLKAIEIELEKLSMELARILEQRKELSSRVAELKRDTELSAAEKADMVLLQKRIAALEEDIARTSPDILTLRRAVVSLQQQIRAEGGPKLAQAQSKVDSLVAQLLLLNKKMVEKEVEETTNRKQAIKASASRVKGENDLKKEQDKLSLFQKEVEEMEEDAAVMIDAIAAATLNVESQSEKLDALRAEYDSLDGKMKLVRVVEIRLGDELRNAERDLKTNSSEAREWREKLEAVRETHVGVQREYNANVREVLRVVKSTNAAATGSSSDAPVEEEEEEEETLELLPDLSAEVLLSSRSDMGEISREIGILEAERDQQEKKGVNMAHLMEWIKKNGQYRLRLADLEVITVERNSARKEYEGLRGQRLEMFMSGFLVITLKLKEMYQMITLGGDAELELLDSLDPFSEGIVFSVRPPKKSWKNISNLSGGEKTLSSLALVFALHHYRPTPLYVMDEIDAALDFKNVSIVANYIKERTKNAQFVIISLRNNMFELADRLVGIYKTHDATKSVTINPRMFAEATAHKGLERISLAGEGAGKVREKVALGDVTNY